MSLMNPDPAARAAVGTIGRGAGGTSPSSGALPHLTTTVPCEFVRRSSMAEVFLTSCRRASETRFTLTGQWPRAHAFFNGPGGQHDPLQAAETIKQVALYLAHAELGVSLGHHFVPCDLSFTSDPDELAIGAVPSDLSIEADCVDLVRKGSRLVEFGLSITIRRNDRALATGTVRFVCVSPGAYHRLRGPAPESSPTQPAHQPSEVAPSAFGRGLRRDVVLASSDHPGRWRLNPDPDHPVLFDIGDDHIPPMVLMEAARQATYGLLVSDRSLTLTAMSTEFHSYAEFGRPCWIEAAPVLVQHSDTMSVLVTGRQDGRRVFGSHVSGTVTRC
ncbi:ScbA/BarX family gamma-butyrolactone biosynthesis protein [Streptomyces sp. NPDC005963]|uniref:ScbA/BarX family gamma-butyrolactone biosynthesis protein n=1 Tax=Streptomyces sp. NPDC005963 TaxID=3156721 RepID=UPI0033D0C235